MNATQIQMNNCAWADASIKLCLNHIAKGLESLPMQVEIKQVQDETSEQFLVLNPKEKPCFLPIVGYFEGLWWSGAVLMEDKDLAKVHNWQDLDKYAKLLRNEGCEIPLSVDELIYVPLHCVESEDFIGFTDGLTQEITHQVLLCQKLNELL